MKPDNNIVVLPKVSDGHASCLNCIRQSGCPLREPGTDSNGNGHGCPVQHKASRKGKHIFRAGDKFDGIYIVQAGFLKSYITDREGELQITGFHFPGEVFGLEGIEDGLYSYSVIALGTGSVCKIPYSQFLRRSNDQHQLMLPLLNMMSKVIARNHKMIFALGKMNAERRFANFLVDVIERMHQSGFNEKDFVLCMTRSDMANYTGLAMETVSRLFGRFQSLGLLQVHRQYLRITDMEGLRAIVHEDQNENLLLDKAG